MATTDDPARPEPHAAFPADNPLQALLGVAIVSLGGPVYRLIQRPVATPAGTHPEVQP